jgi:hypothetical protein
MEKKRKEICPLTWSFSPITTDAITDHAGRGPRHFFRREKEHERQSSETPRQTSSARPRDHEPSAVMSSSPSTGEIDSGAGKSRRPRNAHACPLALAQRIVGSRAQALAVTIPEANSKNALARRVAAAPGARSTRAEDTQESSTVCTVQQYPPRKKGAAALQVNVVHGGTGTAPLQLWVSAMCVPLQ